MATILVNDANTIQFVNADPSNKNADNPTLMAQAGDWENNDHVEAGIVFDTYGAEAPMLTTADARKLAKWLVRAADKLDGVKNSEKKNKHRHHYNEDDEDENNLDRY